MYFRKYFEGTEPYYNSYQNIYINGTSTTKKVYTYQTHIINEAIKETLLAAGIECDYGGIEDKCILRIGGFPVQLLVASNVGNIALYRNGNANPVFTAGTSYGTFSGANYKFYVSLLGDPKSILVITLGYYSNPTNLLYTGIMIAKIIDLRDGSKKIGVASAGSSAVYIYYESGEPLDEIEILNFQGASYNANLCKNGSLIPLLESIDTTGFFKIEQCYRGTSGLLANYNFYNIGGEIFMQPGSSFIYLIKCTTEIN